MAKRLKVIRLLDPKMCLECRFCRRAEVETDLGIKTMIHCLRGDCDNWDTRGPMGDVRSMRKVEHDGS